MRPRLSLQSKILFCALANLILLAAALVVYIGFQFRTGLESILLAPAQGRLQDLGDTVMAGIEEEPSEQWGSILDRESRSNQVELGLFRNDGQHLAGTVRELPDAVARHLNPPRPLPAGFEAAAPPPPPPRKREPPPGGSNPPRRRAPGQEPRAGAHPVFFVIDGEPRAYWFGVRIGAPREDDRRPTPATLIVRSSNVLLTPLLFDPAPWAAGVLAVSAITLLCWIPLIRGLTSSVRNITAGAERIAAGKFDGRISASRRDEIGQLSDALNRMAAQLSGFVNGQKRFLGDVAHELSAPVARAQVTVAILEDRATDGQRGYIDGLKEEVQHMAGLVTELLHFSKAGLVTEESATVAVEVADLVRRVIEREANGAAHVSLSEGGELKLAAQPDAIFRALSNVVRNAVSYAGADGPIGISARREDGHVVLRVSDEGPGLPEDALNRVFTPFYRLDKSRSRDSGGVGLGLAIVKTCVEANGGTVSCHNRTPKGLEVRISLRAA